MRTRKGNHPGWRLVIGFVPALLLPLLLVLLVPRLHAAPTAGSFAVATENPMSTQAAAAQLRGGGNAVDAAVAAALVAGVVNGTSSGIGGGGFALYWDAKTQKSVIVDFRETAPQAVAVAAFDKRPFPFEQRGKATGVPGEAKGLFELQRRFGQRDWASVVQPAIEAAANGFEPSPHMARALASQGENLRKDPKIAELFFPGGGAHAPAKLFNPPLAHVLQWLSQLGSNAIYDGPVASDIVATAARGGGAISYRDLQSYRTVEREPVRISWEGYEIHTMPTPSGGGLMLAQVLGMFSKAELQTWGIDSGAYIHHVGEAIRTSFADRFRYLADPAFVKMDIAGMLSPEKLKARRAAIQPNQTRTLPQLIATEHGTHHLVVADKDGNVVSLTTTVNNAFGAKLMTQSGILLNDQLNDCSFAQDGAKFGLAGSPNRPKANARPVSSMTPTLVLKNGKPVLALGGSGGFRIGPNVVQAVLAHLAFGLPPKAIVQRPRFAVPIMGASLLVDEKAPKALFADLKARGETVEPLKDDYSAVQVLSFTQGKRSAAADPRKAGLAITE
jgi:gamma-glutamyltranspeptidase/glutathione hydrolase